MITYTCDATVVQQFYQTRVIDEFVLRGNTATVKCLIPSFVADFVQVVEWVTEGGSFSASSTSDTDYGNKKCCPLSFCYPSDLKYVFIYSIPPADILFQVDVYRQQAPNFILALTVTLACFYSCEPVL